MNDFDKMQEIAEVKAMAFKEAVDKNKLKRDIAIAIAPEVYKSWYGASIHTGQDTKDRAMNEILKRSKLFIDQYIEGLK